MEHTHEFDCPICGAHLDSRDEQSRHRESAHGHEGRQAASRQESGSSTRGEHRGADGSRRDETSLD